jgi:hypothetical protein
MKKNTNKNTTNVTREDSIKIEVKDGKAVCTINCLEKDLPSVLKTLYEDISKNKIPEYIYRRVTPFYQLPYWYESYPHWYATNNNKYTFGSLTTNDNTADVINSFSSSATFSSVNKDTITDVNC